MQVSCIKCGAALDGDFGMVKCSACGEILLVDLMGEVSPAATTITDRSELEKKAQAQAALEKSVTKPQEVNDDEPQPEEPEVETEEAPPEEAPPADGVWNYDASLEAVEVEKEKPKKKHKPEDLSELVDFANSEVSSAREGPFLYRIRIEGVLTKEIRESVGAALSDRHFGWDPNRLMAQIKNGILIIENVNPAKASVLIKRLKGLRLEISWEQVALSQVDLV